MGCRGVGSQAPAPSPMHFWERIKIEKKKWKHVKWYQILTPKIKIIKKLFYPESQEFNFNKTSLKSKSVSKSSAPPPPRKTLTVPMLATDWVTGIRIPADTGIFLFEGILTMVYCIYYYWICGRWTKSRNPIIIVRGFCLPNHVRTDGLWFPPSLLSNDYRDIYLGSKAAGAWSWPLSSIKYRSKECVELYLFMEWCLVTGL